MVRSLQLWSALLAVLTTTTIRERWNRQAMPAAGGMADAAAPDRFSRTRTVWPLEAGIGAAPASMAKAASLGQRPGCSDSCFRSRMISSTVVALVAVGEVSDAVIGARTPPPLQPDSAPPAG
jgi:hypothetical protein